MGIFRFKNRSEAGKLLAIRLEEYKSKNTIVLAIPRGGVVTAVGIAKFLEAPLGLVITRKIGHPYDPEYALAAVGENGNIVGDKKELELVDKAWLENEVNTERLEAKRRRELYLQNRKPIPIKGKVVILVDDGIATGLTVEAAIMEIKHEKAKSIIVAVPVCPESTAEKIKKEVKSFVCINLSPDESFLGTVGAYYEEFSSVEDNEVINLLKSL